MHIHRENRNLHSNSGRLPSVHRFKVSTRAGGMYLSIPPASVAPLSVTLRPVITPTTNACYYLMLVRTYHGVLFSIIASLVPTVFSICTSKFSLCTFLTLSPDFLCIFPMGISYAFPILRSLFLLITLFPHIVIPCTAIPNILNHPRSW